MGRVSRRSVVALVVAALAAAPAACSSERAPAPPAAARPQGSSLPPAASIPAAPGTTPATATPSATRAPARAFAVGTGKLTLRRGADRPLPTSLWYPKGDGPFPLIVFSHGLTARPADYAALVIPWARAGFVVAAPAYPHTSAGAKDFNVLDVLNQPTDASYVLTQTLAKLGDLVDPKRVAAAGHSAGAVTTLGLFSSNRDERLRAGVVLAGRQVLGSPFAGPQAPMLFVHGTRDPTVAYADGQAAYDAVPWPKAFLTVKNGGHVATGAALDAVTATTVDFWRWTLYRDEAARARLDKDAGKAATLKSRL